MSGRGAGRAPVVELVGPAGAGKSTLAAMIPERDRRFSGTVSVWRQPRRSLLISAGALLPTVMAALLGGAPLKPSEIAQMIRIDALRRRLRRARAEGRAVLLDEGPVFALSQLLVFYGRNGDPGYAAWRRRAIRAWADLLDAVVHLDANDAVLAQRIKSRQQPHIYKDAPPEEIAAFCDAFRKAFDRVLSELAAHGVPVVRLSTEHDELGQRASALHHAIQEAIGD